MMRSYQSRLQPNRRAQIGAVALWALKLAVILAVLVSMARAAANVSVGLPQVIARAEVEQK